jgi:DNA-binding NtrC family response regulator
MKEITIPSAPAVVAGSPQQPEKPGQPVANGYSVNGLSLTLRSHRTRAEINAVRQALEQTGWNRKQAARVLAISYRGLLYKIQRHKITRSSSASGESQDFAAQPQSAGQNWAG